MSALANKERTAITTPPPPSSASAKANAMAQKVAVMKMKMHAEGDDRIPPERRVYVEVHYPSGDSALIKPKPMYFDSKYSVGKVLDLVAEAAKIENNNNKANSQKLCLTLVKTGAVLPPQVSLAESGVSSGDAIAVGPLEAPQEDSI